jgi:GTP-binding protein HflX
MHDEFDVEEEEFEEAYGIEDVQGKETVSVCIGVYKGGEKGRLLCQDYLNELADLADTFGCTVSEKMALSIRTGIDAATFVSKGKLDEIKEMIQKTGSNLVIFDDEITPAQQRNLEKIFKVAVMDRTELILEIFAQRAVTKEARLQVELARIKYQFPRLKRLWSHFSRQRHSGGHLKGEGEKQIEIDRRLLKKQLQRLRDELEEVKKVRRIQKQQRSRSFLSTFAIVGYTNAGKSTLLNALTDSDVLVEDKLFATLDPTTRKYTLPDKQQILLTDTVGFIRKLPHTLVAAFRSTLEAALHDDVLLHLIDASHPMCIEQAETTHQLLRELGAHQGSIITVLNKVDLCEDQSRLQQLKIKYPKTVVISATQRTGFDELMQMMMRELSEKRSKIKLRIPQSRYDLVAHLKAHAHILNEEYEENDVILSVELSKADLPPYTSYIIS